MIVIDDGSTDATGEAVRPFSKSGAVRYELREHRGTPAGRNEGLELARGDLIAFIDADDLWLPGKLSMQVNILDADASLDMVLGHVRQFVRLADLSESDREGLLIMPRRSRK